LDHKKDGKFYEDITATYNERNVNPNIKVKSLGEGQFEGTADYDEGKIKFDIILDRINPSFGLGTFQYISKKEIYKQPDLGKFELLRDKVNPDRLFIYHKNIIPTGATEGYEIWEKC